MTQETELYRLQKGGRSAASGIFVQAVMAVVASITTVVWLTGEWTAGFSAVRLCFTHNRRDVSGDRSKSRTSRHPSGRSRMSRASIARSGRSRRARPGEPVLRTLQRRQAVHSPVSQTTVVMEATTAITACTKIPDAADRPPFYSR